MIRAQYSWPVSPKTELLPYKWERGGEMEPWSSWPCLPGIELLQDRAVVNEDAGGLAFPGRNCHPRLEAEGGRGSHLLGYTHPE